jgi:glycosyltransferase involved in cell wall biosynthesis
LVSEACLVKRILYVQYTNPAGYPPLEHSSRILASEGWKVLFLGTGAQGANILEFPPHPNIEVRKMQFCPAGWRQKLHYFGFGLWTIFGVMRWRPKWIYASDPLSCPVALALSFLPGLRVIYHEHDSPTGEKQKAENGKQKASESNKVGGQGAEIKSENNFCFLLSQFLFSFANFQRLIMCSRKKLACRASLCVLPNEKRVEHFKEQTGTSRPVVCVWNCPRLEEAAVDGQVKSGKFIVFYHGSIVPARLPLAVVGALKHLPDTVILRIAGYETAGHRGYVEAIRAEARRIGVESRIEFLGAFFYRQDLLKRCREADVGLSFMPVESEDLNMSAMVGASNKPFDYLACGLALLVSDLPDWNKMFVEPGFGLGCNPDDSTSIAAALRWFIDHPDETRKIGQKGRERILKEWNYEKQFGPVLQHMHEV